MKRKVVRVDQSMLNPDRWCFQLDCGHDIWVTSRWRPKNKKMECPWHLDSAKAEP